MENLHEGDCTKIKAKTWLERKDWIQMSGAGSLKGALRRTFFGWPDFTGSLIQPWAADLPVLGGSRRPLFFLFHLKIGRKSDVNS